MIKYAAEQVKLAHFAGTAAAMRQFGFSAPTVYAALMEKGASSEDAEQLTKEAFGLLARGLGAIGSKALPAIGKFVGRFAGSGAAGAAAKGTQLSLPGMGAAATKPGLLGRFGGWAQGAAERAGKSFNTAAQGMKTNPWGTLGGGAKNFAHGALLGGGTGVGGGLGKATLGTMTASAILGG